MNQVPVGGTNRDTSPTLFNLPNGITSNSAALNLFQNAPANNLISHSENCLTMAAVRHNELNHSMMNML
jgi:hypothetical protein